MWYGYMPSVCSVLLALVWGTTRCRTIFLHTSTWTVLYHLNTFLFVDILIKLTLSCNVSAGECAVITLCMVSLSKHSLCWYCTVWRMSQVCSYSMHCSVVTKIVLMNGIRKLCNWTFMLRSEHDIRTETRIRTELHILYGMSVLPLPKSVGKKRHECAKGKPAVCLHQQPFSGRNAN